MGMYHGHDGGPLKLETSLYNDAYLTNFTNFVPVWVGVSWCRPSRGVHFPGSPPPGGKMKQWMCTDNMLTMLWTYNILFLISDKVNVMRIMDYQSYHNFIIVAALTVLTAARDYSGWFLWYIFLVTFTENSWLGITNTEGPVSPNLM